MVNQMLFSEMPKQTLYLSARADFFEFNLTLLLSGQLNGRPRYVSTEPAFGLFWFVSWKINWSTSGAPLYTGWVLNSPDTNITDNLSYDARTNSNNYFPYNSNNTSLIWYDSGSANYIDNISIIP
jgi:hypothetical protein